MPTSPYSLDLRDRVIKYIKSGKSQKEAAKVFCLNLSTVNRWYLRYSREGNCLPRRRLGAKSKIDKGELIRYVDANPDMKLQDLSKKFGISICGIYYWLKKLGFSYKKKPSAMWRRIKESKMIT